MTNKTAVQRLVESLAQQGLIISESNMAVQEALSIEQSQLRHAYDIGSLKAVDALFGHKSISFEQFYQNNYESNNQ